MPRRPVLDGLVPDHAAALALAHVLLLREPAARDSRGGSEADGSEITLTIKSINFSRQASQPASQASQPSSAANFRRSQRPLRRLNVVIYFSEF